MTFRIRPLTWVAAGLTAALAAVGLGPVGPASAAGLTQVTNFGTNPSNLNMYVYIPANVQAKPAILVAVHYCTGTASAFYSGYAAEWVAAANTYGYIMVFPEATRSGQCFDVYSPQGLTRNGGSDSQGIMSMVTYAEQHYNGDPSRVYAMGASSGAMMTNVLLAEYPDVFKAGSAFMGVPATCFATGSASNTWNSDCSGGNITKTAQQWGDAARAMYPGYSGSYPRMQLWHGTADTTLNYHNFGEEIKQWTNLNGVSATPVLTDSPVSGWTRTRYGTNTVQAPVEGISVAGVGHSIPTSGMAAYSIAFLGLNGTPTTTTTTTRPVTTTTTRPVTTTTTTTTTRPVTTTTTTRPVTTTTTASGGSAGCTAAFSISSSWTGGFVGAVTVTAGSTTLNSWKVTLGLPSGTSINNLWSGVASGTSGSVTVTNAAYNGHVAAGTSTTFGFQGNGSGSGTTVSCTGA